MRIAIPALGTRGDVLPYVVLGQGLRRAGHEVVLSTMERYRELVESHGLRFHALPGDPADVFAATTLDVSSSRPLKHLNVIRTGVGALVEQVKPDELLSAWSDVDLVIFSTSTTFAAFAAGELGARGAMVVFCPYVVTGAFAHPVLSPSLRLGRYGNRASWLLGERLARQTFQEPLKPRERRARGLPLLPLVAPADGARWPPFPVLHAYSGEVVARPPDWPAHVEVTGWLSPPSSGDPLAGDVERFLGEGPPPLYIGFGSMPVADPERIAGMLVTSLARAGQRAIVSGAGLAHAAPLQHADSVLAVDEVPHEDLFARVSGVVHHGGSGTVGAGLRAGRPTLVVPFVFDQFFWGRRVHSLGAGPAPIPISRLTVDSLSRALARLSCDACRDVARALGERIRAEEGTDRAVTAIERIMS